MSYLPCLVGFVTLISQEVQKHSHIWHAKETSHEFGVLLVSGFREYDRLAALNRILQRFGPFDLHPPRAHEASP